VNFPF